MGRSECINLIAVSSLANNERIPSKVGWMIAPGGCKETDEATGRQTGVMFTGAKLMSTLSAGSTGHDERWGQATPSSSCTSCL